MTTCYAGSEVVREEGGGEEVVREDRRRQDWVAGREARLRERFYQWLDYCSVVQYTILGVVQCSAR